MTANEFQHQALKTENTPNFVTVGHEVDAPGKRYPALEISRALHAAIGAATEAGELLDNLKKFLIYGKRDDEINRLEEWGDLLWYAAIGLDADGFTIEEAMEACIRKLKVRYPEKFTATRALSRDLGAEREALERKKDG